MASSGGDTDFPGKIPRSASDFEAVRATLLACAAARRAAAPTPPCVAELAAELGRAESTIYKGLRLVRESAASPDVTAQPRKRAGRPRTLSPEENAVLRAAFRKDPVGGPGEAAKVLFAKCGVRASRSTICREMARRYQPGDAAIRKRGTDRYAPLSPQLISMHLGHCLAMDACFASHGF